MDDDIKVWLTKVGEQWIIRNTIGQAWNGDANKFTPNQELCFTAFPKETCLSIIEREGFNLQN